MYGVFNHGLRKLAGLEEFLGGPVVRCLWNTPVELTATAGWGKRKYSKRARRIARERGIPFVCLEDGFLRSVGLGNQDPPLSLVVDDLGIYYDATCPSRLEAMITRSLALEGAARANGLIAGWQAGRVSKYNHAREMEDDLPSGHFILVADQTKGDASIRYGLANEKSFSRMLEAALEEHPDSTILLKVHPDVFAGRKRGHFDRLTPGQASRVVVLGRDVHPVGLLERAEAVYTVTSQMGFEGLLWGKPVHTFGMPFYAGWGLTNDELSTPERRKPVPLENLVHAALVAYPRYIDPETGKSCGVERVLEHLSLQRKMRGRFSATVHAVGFSRWKKPIVRAYFQGSEVSFVPRIEDVPQGGTLAVWGRKNPFPSPPAPLPQGARGELAPCSTLSLKVPTAVNSLSTGGRGSGRGGTGDELRIHNGVKLVRLEDGFLRSVGLGAELVRPLSWVMDGTGMYYDAGAPSDLENLLQTASFDEALIGRARRLREAICAHGISKYNVGERSWQRPVDSRRVILVPGQVESDASIRYGASGIKRNIDLLKAVRADAPDAYVVYKPHPDVHAGLRRSGEGEGEADRWCDEVVVDVPIHELLAVVDEVHVLTSLTGFEALLRGLRVVTYGRPFYAGWGLTGDIAPPDRRTRRLSLDELIAGALILYPVYVSRRTGRFTTPERALDELLAWRKAGVTTRPVWRRLLRLLVNMGERD
jgi:capsular polysaccharide export protein